MADNSSIFTISKGKITITGVINYCKQENLHAPILIMTHGFRGSQDGGGRAIVLAEELSAFCNVVRFNFGDTQILSQQVHELTLVINYMKEKYPLSKFFVLGRSMGGVTALLTVHQRKDITGLILWAMPSDIRQTFMVALGKENYEILRSGKSIFLDDERGYLELQPKFIDDCDRYDIHSILSNWRSCPVFVIHGDSDNLVALEQAHKTFALLPEIKKIEVIRGGDHSFTEHSAIVTRKVVNWLKTFC